MFNSRTRGTTQSTDQRIVMNWKYCFAVVSAEGYNSRRTPQSLQRRSFWTGRTILELWARVKPWSITSMTEIPSNSFCVFSSRLPNPRLLNKPKQRSGAVSCGRSGRRPRGHVPFRVLFLGHIGATLSGNYWKSKLHDCSRLWARQKLWESPKQSYFKLQYFTC